MNKKLLALALSGALTLSLLAACGSPDAEGSAPPRQHAPCHREPDALSLAGGHPQRDP